MRVVEVEPLLSVDSKASVDIQPQRELRLELSGSREELHTLIPLVENNDCMIGRNQTSRMVKLTGIGTN